MDRKLILSLLAGTLFSAVTLYFAFRNVPFSELVRYLKSIDYYVVIPASAAIVAAFVFRGLRWRVILGPAKEVTFFEAFHPLMIGFMANCVYPGRVGEIGRPLILKAKSGVPFSTGLATVGVERLLDLLCLVLLFGIALHDTDPSAAGEVGFMGYRIDGSVLADVGKGMIALGALIAAAIALISSARARKLAESIIARIPGLLFFLHPSRKEKFAVKLSTTTSGFMENLASGFALVKSPRRIIVCLIYSSLVWAFSIYSYYIVAKGSPGIDLTVMETTAVMVLICFAIALPSAPGYWGLWEAGGVFALSLFGIDQKDAAGYTLANHAIQIFPVVLVGLVSAWLTGVDFKIVARQKDRCNIDDDDLKETV